MAEHRKRGCRTTVWGHSTRCISADFRQNTQFTGDFSTRTESGPDLLSTMRVRNSKNGNGALYGRIWAWGNGEGGTVLDRKFRIPEVAGHLTRDGKTTRDRSGAPTG